MHSKPSKLRPRGPSWRHHGQYWTKGAAKLAPTSPILPPSSRQFRLRSHPDGARHFKKPLKNRQEASRPPSSLIFDPSKPNFPHFSTLPDPSFQKCPSSLSLWLRRLLFIRAYRFCHHPCLRPCFPRHLKVKGPAAEALAFKPDFAWNRKAHYHDAVTP